MRGKRRWRMEEEVRKKTDEVALTKVRVYMEVKRLHAFPAGQHFSRKYP